MQRSDALTTAPESPAALPADRPRWITWRSILLGSLAVAATCALVPYNDYVVENTFLVGSFFPPALVLAILVLVVGINAPLRLFAPHRALSKGELGTILAMLLAGCSIPSQGLMRSLVPQLVSVFHFSNDARFWSAFVNMHFPRRMFPVEDIHHGWESKIVEYFYSRIPPGSGMSVPYAAWAGPMAFWAIFFGALLATLVALAVLVLPQWATNERLAFPLAQVELALIETPERGRALNSLFRSGWFWGGLLAVFIVESLTALNRYFPHSIPKIPVGYDLTTILANEPWSALTFYVKKNQVYFTFIGITYFIQARVSFSLWAIFIVQQAISMLLRQRGTDLAVTQYDEHLGACVAYMAGVTWIGRHHWKQVIAGAFGRKQDELRTSRIALVVALVGIVVMSTWLVALGCHVWVAVALVGLTLLAHLVTARIVAETGLPYFRPIIDPKQIYQNVPVKWLTAKDIYFCGVIAQTGPYDARESTSAFVLQGLRGAEASESSMPRKTFAGLVGLIGWALILGFIVALVSSLHCYYRYATPISAHTQALYVNDHSVDYQPKTDLVTPMDQYLDGHFPNKSYNPWTHMAIGAGITALLQALSLRSTAWPLLPVGYIGAGSWYVPQAWFSLFVGWLAKVLIVRFGGIRLYHRLRPLFIGIIFGEGLAAGAWLVINLILASTGHDYQVVSFLPT